MARGFDGRNRMKRTRTAAAFFWPERFGGVGVLPMLKTIDQAAEALQVSRRTVWRWIRCGTLPSVRLPGRLVRVEERALLALIQRSRIANG
jgi:excisionase family DNA binding protein